MTEQKRDMSTLKEDMLEQIAIAEAMGEPIRFGYGQNCANNIKRAFGTGGNGGELLTGLNLLVSAGEVEKTPTGDVVRRVGTGPRVYEYPVVELTLGEQVYGPGLTEDEVAELTLGELVYAA